MSWDLLGEKECKVLKKWKNRGCRRESGRLGQRGTLEGGMGNDELLEEEVGEGPY